MVLTETTNENKTRTEERNKKKDWIVMRKKLNLKYILFNVQNRRFFSLTLYLLPLIIHSRFTYSNKRANRERERKQFHIIRWMNDKTMNDRMVEKLKNNCRLFRYPSMLSKTILFVVFLNTWNFECKKKNAHCGPD